jgi:hypothetical protein
MVSAGVAAVAIRAPSPSAYQNCNLTLDLLAFTERHFDKYISLDVAGRRLSSGALAGGEI